jgi:hypothetical protein
MVKHISKYIIPWTMQSEDIDTCKLFDNILSTNHGISWLLTRMSTSEGSLGHTPD